VTSGCICSASEDEEQIGQTVQVHERERIHGVEARRRQRLTLGAAAGRPRHVESCSEFASARKHEALELREVGIELVAVALEGIHLLLRDTEARVLLHRDREVGAEIEEFVLDAAEHSAHVVRAIDRQSEADGRVQLIDGPVRCDPRIELRDARPVAERRLSCVTPSGVDLGQPDRLVAIAGHARRLGGVDVRPLRTGESETIAEVFIASFRGLTFLPALHTDDQIRTWIQDQMVPAHEVWVAEETGRIRGFAAITGDLLGHIYVRPEDQSRGVGTALLDVVKRERPTGFTFWVFQRNEGARRFYERRGCRLVELTDGSGNEEKEPDALYEWRPSAL